MHLIIIIIIIMDKTENLRNYVELQRTGSRGSTGLLRRLSSSANYRLRGSGPAGLHKATKTPVACRAGYRGLGIRGVAYQATGATGRWVALHRIPIYS